MLSYNTIKQNSIFEMPKIKWSKFIGYSFFIENLEEWISILDRLKKEHHQATHHCRGCRTELKYYENLFGEWNYDFATNKYNDDGEPSGTASYPIKNILEKKNIWNVMIVIVRYFGGTRLWIGWLISAYGDCTNRVLTEGWIISKPITKIIQKKLKYEFLGVFQRTLEKYDAKIINSRYESDYVFLDIEINVEYTSLEEFTD